MSTDLPIRTHQAISARLSGRALRVDPDESEVELVLHEEMAADSTGLVHGGFLFSAADYAAMLAVNEPYVVLAAASTRFLMPSRVGDVLRFIARVERSEGRKRSVSVRGVDEQQRTVFEGTFECAALARHVLAARDG
ncbi:MAG: PaaI family thioesterase [Burkholderiaceae bacterium]